MLLLTWRRASEKFDCYPKMSKSKFSKIIKIGALKSAKAIILTIQSANLLLDILTLYFGLVWQLVP